MDAEKGKPSSSAAVYVALLWAYGLLDQLAKARTSCGQPQLACLSTTLESHGLFPEGKKWVTRNFSALERREELGSALPAGARTGRR